MHTHVENAHARTHIFTYVGVYTCRRFNIEDCSWVTRIYMRAHVENAHVRTRLFTYVGLYTCRWFKIEQYSWAHAYVCMHTWKMHTYTSTYLHMGWLRSVGAWKFYVSFAKEPYKRDDILQRIHINLRSLLIVATLYLWIFTHVDWAHTHIYVCTCEKCTQTYPRFYICK